MAEIAAGTPSEDGIDRGYLQRQTMGDEALAAELLRLFVAQTSALMAMIERDGPAGQRRDAAHTLKGAASAIGAFAVAAEAALTEAAVDAAPEDLGRHISALRAAVAASREAIARWFHAGDEAGKSA